MKMRLRAIALLLACLLWSRAAAVSAGDGASSTHVQLALMAVDVDLDLPGVQSARSPVRNAERFDIAVQLAGGDAHHHPLGGAQFTLSYDPTVLRLIAARQGELLPPPARIFQSVRAPDAVSVAVVTSSVDKTTDDLSLAVVTFEVIGRGEAQLRLSGTKVVTPLGVSHPLSAPLSAAVRTP